MPRSRCRSTCCTTSTRTGSRSTRNTGTSQDPRLRGQVEQLMMNLLSNAFAAIKGRGCPHPPAGGGVEIEIEDNGVGIPKENLKRIQTFTTKPVGQGIGLGLSMLRHRATPGQDRRDQLPAAGPFSPCDSSRGEPCDPQKMSLHGCARLANLQKLERTFGALGSTRRARARGPGILVRSRRRDHHRPEMPA